MQTVTDSQLFSHLRTEGRTFRFQFLVLAQVPTHEQMKIISATYIWKLVNVKAINCQMLVRLLYYNAQIIFVN